VYVALYGPKGSVIFDHPYNAEYLRPRFRNGAAPVALILFSSVRVAVRSVPRLLSSSVRQDFMPCLLDSRVGARGHVAAGRMSLLY
jgi:hypothetical protein